MGSLRDFGVKYEQVDLNSDGEPDIPAITEAVKAKQPKIVYIQRSRGYTLRPSLSVEKIAEISKAVKSVSDSIVFVDNCYGEFVQRVEPVQVGRLGAECACKNLIERLASSVAVSEGRRAELFCKDGSIVEFYKKSGFAPVGRWAEYDSEQEI